MGETEISKSRHESLRMPSTEPLRMPSARVTPAVKGTESALLSGLVLETQGATAKVINIEALWDAPADNPSQVLRAIDLLKQTADLLERALKVTDAIEADRLVQQVQATLPKLFSYRSVGDGFGLIINSVHYAFVNLKGTPLSQPQMRVMWRVLRELRLRPAMSADQGIERVTEMEETGLAVDPPGIGDFVEHFEAMQDD